MLCALIMAGGKGTRFWPLSTEEKPKQFLNLIGDDTMIQMTVNRIKPIIPIERVFVCTGERYRDLVRKQLPELPERNIIIEPEGRNTAPCIALSALVIKRYYKDATMVVLPSDHLIGQEERFRDIIKASREFVNDNKEAILTLGMKPTRPETGYGYINYGNHKEVIDDYQFIKVNAFVEKPNRQKAKEYVENGTYLWNGGMFMWKVDNILNQLKKYSPDTYEALHGISQVDEKELQMYIDDNYRKTESISIDYAVLEKSQDIFVVPSDIAWDDIGSWNAIERYRDKDDLGNIVSDGQSILESKENIVINNKKKIVMIGVENLLAIDTDDAIYIVNKNYMENLREYKDEI